MKIVHNIKLASLILALVLLPSQALLADCPCSSQDVDDVLIQQDINNQDQDAQDINNADPDQ